MKFTAESGRKSGGSGVVASETEQRSAAADEAALSARRSAGRPADTGLLAPGLKNATCSLIKLTCLRAARRHQLTFHFFIRQSKMFHF